MIASSAGSAAYEGYKYEHKKDQPTATASSGQTKKTTATASSTQSTKSTASSQKKIPDSDIE